MNIEITNGGQYVGTLEDVSEDLQDLTELLEDIFTQQGGNVGDLEHASLQEAAEDLLYEGKTTISELDLKTEEFIRKPGKMPWLRMPRSPKSLIRELFPKASMPHNAASGCLRRIVVQNVPKQVLGQEITKQIVRQNAARQMLGPEIAKHLTLPGIGVPITAVAFGVHLLVAAAMWRNSVSPVLRMNFDGDVNRGDC